MFLLKELCNMKNLINVFLTPFLFITSVLSQCENWVSIPPEEYNKTFVYLNDPNANEVRPLGFKVSSLVFGGTKPCFIVSDTAGNNRHIEIKWELELPSTLCVQDNFGNDADCDSSESNSVCSVVPDGADSITYTFLCDGEGCEGGTKTFWYRFVVEPSSDEGQFDDDWCSKRNSEYPGSLAPLPQLFFPEPGLTSSPTTVRPSGDTQKAADDDSIPPDIVPPTSPPTTTPGEAGTNQASFFFIIVLVTMTFLAS